MRIASFLTAILVAAGLYAFVIERDTVLAIARDYLQSDTDAPIIQAEAATAANDEGVGRSGPGARRPGPPPEADAADGIVRVVAIRSTARPIESGVVLRGQTEAVRFVDVKSESTGLVVSDPMRKGSFVRKGQVLCVLDPGSRFADLNEAEARLEEATINERNTSILAEEGFAAENMRNAARAALESATAAVERARVAVNRLQIEAPFDGLLESDAAETGTLLQPGSLCATIVQLDPIKVVGYLSDVEVDRVAVGNVATARLTSGRHVAGIVTYISRSGDRNTRTFRIEIGVDNEDLTIRDGSAAEIFIAGENQLAHLVPQSAITLNDAGQLGLRTVVDGKALFNPIRILRDTPDGAWVEGLPEEATVIVVGHEFVIDGTPVTASYRSLPS